MSREVLMTAGAILVFLLMVGLFSYLDGLVTR